MQKAGAEVPNHIVRYPRALLVGPIILLAISAVGIYMALTGRGHWTFWHVAGFSVVGALFLLHVTTYRTTFSSDTVEQRVFPGGIRRLRYADIGLVKWKWAGAGRMLLLVLNDGKPMKVYGSDDGLLEAQNVLFEQVPQAFRN